MFFSEQDCTVVANKQTKTCNNRLEEIGVRLLAYHACASCVQPLWSSKHDSVINLHHNT